MALAVDTPSGSQKGAAVSSLTFSHTCSTGSDRLLFVGAGSLQVSGGSVDASGVTYAGDSLTNVWTTTGQTYGANSGWRKIAPATGANNIVVTWPSTIDEVAAGGISFTGAHQTTPLGTAATANGVDGPATVDVTSAADEIVVDNVIAMRHDLTVGASQTQRWVQNQLGATEFIGAGGGSTESGAATVTMSWTIGNDAPAGFDDRWLIGGVGVKPAAGGGGGTCGRLPLLGAGGKCAVPLAGLEWLRRRKNKIRQLV